MLHADGDVERGEVLYTGACEGCHGANAQGSRFWDAPCLAGQYAVYLRRQLRYFRDGVRGADPGDGAAWTMAGMVRGLPDERARDDVMAYIATLEAPPAPASEVSELGDAERGKELYTTLCLGCHGSRGQGNYYYPSENPPPNPRLAGQHDWYLLRQLQNFDAGRRGTHEKDEYGRWMRAGLFVQLDGEQDFRDIVAYIQFFR